MLLAINSNAQTAMITNNASCRWHVVVICWVSPSLFFCSYLPLPPYPPNTLQTCCIKQEDHYNINAGQVLAVPFNGPGLTSYKASDLPAGTCPGSNEVAWSNFSTTCDNPIIPGNSSAVPNCSCASPAVISMVGANQVEIN